MPRIVGVAVMTLALATSGCSWTIRASVSGSGAEGNGIDPVLSGDGRYVVFQSNASNLVPGDANNLPDISPTSVQVEVRVLDRDTRTTQTVAVSVSSSFALTTGEDISDDGRYVVCSTDEAHVPEDTNGTEDVYERDLVVNRTFLAGRSALREVGQRGASAGDISDDGRYIAFHSLSANLVAADTHDDLDVFVRAFPQPEPRSATSSSVARGTTTTISIEGDYLLPSSQIAITGAGVSVDSVAWASDHQLDATISVAPDAATGSRGVLVTIAGTGAGHDRGAIGGCGCLTIV
jgi:Tol biopolymer transport system component